MKLRDRWLELDEVASTQEAAAELLERADGSIGVVFAHHQVSGRGRFGREWVSQRGDSLTMSILFWDYAGCPKPWLLGMAVAMATAKTIGCNVRWPNDLSFGDRKTGGILTELLSAAGSRQVPVCGVGINLRQVAFPPELPHATSVLLETGVQLDAELLAGEIVAALREMPEPLEWSDLSDQWMTYDHTPGKRYKMLDGKEGVALGISHDAALRCVVDGVERKVLAADALFGVLARDA